MLLKRLAHERLTALDHGGRSPVPVIDVADLVLNLGQPVDSRHCCPLPMAHGILDHMPTGPKGQKRPADVISAAVKVMRIATGQEEEGEEAPKTSEGHRGGGLKG